VRWLTSFFYHNMMVMVVWRVQHRTRCFYGALRAHLARIAKMASCVAAVIQLTNGTSSQHCGSKQEQKRFAR